MMNAAPVTTNASGHVRHQNDSPLGCSNVTRYGCRIAQIRPPAAVTGPTSETACTRRVRARTAVLELTNEVSKMPPSQIGPKRRTRGSAQDARGSGRDG